MIDSAVLKRLLIVAAALLVVSAGAAISLGAPLPFAGGLALGYLLAAAPIASWAWVAPRLLQGKSKALAVVLLFLKMGFYAAALYVGVYKHLVNPIGVLVGMTGVGTVIVLGLLLRSPSPAKEAA
jgi:hypothetical protein